MTKENTLICAASINDRFIEALKKRLGQLPIWNYGGKNLNSICAGSSNEIIKAISTLIELDAQEHLNDAERCYKFECCLINEENRPEIASIFVRLYEESGNQGNIFYGWEVKRLDVNIYSLLEYEEQSDEGFPNN